MYFPIPSCRRSEREYAHSAAWKRHPRRRCAARRGGRFTSSMPIACEFPPSWKIARSLLSRLMDDRLIESEGSEDRVQDHHRSCNYWRIRTQCGGTASALSRHDPGGTRDAHSTSLGSSNVLTRV